ncbi:alpha/beta fold hydrolase [Microbacterium sp. SORGH_AS_0888]|uniref:alpha/beta fold hydrolase n=1 Tax=Microbacterium sp. SORGH_AS_0888 TaxID=3041791 RepID=UPI0027D77500|nr:alpha/beta hydrolase [Microbacterium sp. SORGH_AS_0888]
MTVTAVMVHGIRTSATMWRAQREYLDERDVRTVALDLPGHGTRMSEDFTLAEAFATIDRAVREAAASGPVILVGHSMGGLLSVEYAGSDPSPPLAALVAASCTAIPRGAALATYRALVRSADVLPDRGMWAAEYVLDRTLPAQTRADFGAGGYALDTQHVALAALAGLDLATALSRIRVPTWFVNGQYDQLRVNERLFTRLVPHAELVVVPRTSHLVTAMRPEVFNAVLALALATVTAASPASPYTPADSTPDTRASDVDSADGR